MMQIDNDPFISNLIDERDAAIAKNRALEAIATSQDLDLQHASNTIRHLCANVEAKSRLLDTAYAEVAQLRNLVANTYNVHFDYINVSNEEWMNLFVSTLKDMETIAEEQQKKQGDRQSCH